MSLRSRRLRGRQGFQCETVSSVAKGATPATVPTGAGSCTKPCRTLSRENNKCIIRPLTWKMALNHRDPEKGITLEDNHKSLWLADETRVDSLCYTLIPLIASLLSLSTLHRDRRRVSLPINSLHLYGYACSFLRGQKHSFL